MALFDDVSREDMVRIQIGLLTLILTFNFWFGWATSQIPLISQLTAIFTIMPIFMVIHLVMITASYLPFESITNFRLTCRFYSNFAFTYGFLTFLSGAFFFLVFYTLGWLNFFVETKIAGYPIFAIPWLGLPTILFIVLFFHERNHRQKLEGGKNV